MSYIPPEVLWCHVVMKETGGKYYKRKSINILDHSAVILMVTWKCLPFKDAIQHSLVVFLMMIPKKSYLFQGQHIRILLYLFLLINF